MADSAKDWLDKSLSKGRYKIEKELGSGGMAHVLLAWDVKLSAHVVVKVPRAALLVQPGMADRFEQEIRSLVQLMHPHIVRVLDVGRHNDVPFAVLQYLAGGNLDERRRHGSRGPVTAVDPNSLEDWLPVVAKALDYIHGKSYVHRDVKPENILFDQQGNAFLGDFGIAKALADSKDSAATRGLTGTGMVVGTADYIAPEVVLGDDYDGRSDQYSLAVTVYEMIAGRQPFTAVTPAAALVEKATKRAPSLASFSDRLRQPLCVAVDRALLRDPAARYESCAAFAAAAMSRSVPAASKAAPVPAAAAAVPVPAAPSTPAAPSPAAAVATAATPVPAQQYAVNCPSCGRKLSVPSNALGMRLNCPDCGATIQMTQPAAAATQRFAAQATQRQAAPLPHAATGTAPAAPFGGARSYPPGGQTTTPTRRRNWIPAVFAGGAIALLLSAALFAGLIVMVFDPFGGGGNGGGGNGGGGNGGGEVLDAFAGTRAGQTQSDNALNLSLVWCPPGTFTMGSPLGEQDRHSDEDQVQVTLTRGFWIGQHEVTQAQWIQVMGSEPWSGQDDVRLGDDYPASYVGWNDAMRFCQNLTQQEHQRGTLPSDWRYALPTDAQWEYACRAGTTTRYCFGEDDAQLGQYAWNIENAGDAGQAYAHVVGGKRPNPWGMYDVHGNVWEWCRDQFVETLPGGRDPEATGTGDDRVLRSGGWRFGGGSCRSADRGTLVATSNAGNLGLRIICEATGPRRATASAKPALLVVPFDRSQAQATQQQWARYLGKSGPVETNSLGMKLMLIPAGEFQMGSPPAERDREDDEFQHRVRITKPYYLGVYEVTQGQYQAVVGSNPSRFSAGGTDAKYRDRVAGQNTSKHPVDNVAWYDAMEFCNKLSSRESLPAYYRLSNVQRASGLISKADVSIAGGKGYRLPTEAEWEFACRGGTVTPLYFGSRLVGHQANVDGNYPYADTTKGPFLGATKPVGSYAANSFGLYDTTGNIGEWCTDWYDADYFSQFASRMAVDPIGPSGGELRVLRGCSWFSYCKNGRSANRDRTGPSSRDVYFGLRVARSP